jgi:hypothetical protein
MDDRARLNILAGLLDSLILAFERHRTATHEVKPSFCKTCRASDADIAQAKAVLAEARR